MRYKNLSIKGFISEVQEVSSGPHPRKFCFVLGAGASKSSGIKSGQELVDIWEKELLERDEESYLLWRKQLNINDSNKYSFYSQYYEKRFQRQPIDGYNYLEKLMENAEPSIGYVMLSYILTRTNHNVVITTNFDHLAEDAVSYYTQTIPLIIGHEMLYHYISRQINRPTIIKIHRDLLFDPKSRTNELQKLHENWERALDIIFSEYHPIFIGYAGNDKSLMDFLIDNSKKFLEDSWKFPYWMIYKTDELNGQVLQFLEETEGYLIRHNGFDEILFLLGDAFNYKLPTKEVFLEDAEKRYFMLSNAIDEFTEKSAKGNAVQDGNSLGSGEEVEQAIERMTVPFEVQRLYRDAVKLHNMGKYQEALVIKEKLIEAEPGNARYHDSLSTTLHEMGRYEEALKEAQRAVELEPDNAKYHNGLGVTLHEMGRYEEALKEKQKAVELEPGNAEYHDSLSVTLHEMGRYEEALKEAQRAVEQEPGNARYHYSLGVTLHELGRYEEALKEKQEAVELSPDNIRFQHSLDNTKQKINGL